MLILSRTACALLLVLAACGKDGDGTPVGPGGSSLAATLQITPGAATIGALGDTVRLDAEVRDQRGQPIPGAGVSWASLDHLIATVSSAGVVRAVANGSARIIATSGSMADTAAITVAQVAAQVEVAPAIVSVAKGDTARLSAVVRDANAHEIDGAAIVWSSADQSIAAVDQTGLVTTTMLGGETQITATSGAASGSATLTGLDELLFTSNRDGNDEIYSMVADGSGQSNLTNHGASDTEPVWSPDGTKIAFTTNRNVNLDILVMSADGSVPVNLTSAPSAAADFEPAWSPDGTRLAYRSTRTLDFEVHVMNADGTGIANVSNHGAFDGEPLWSPDGGTIAFLSNRDGNNEIYAVHPDGTDATNLTMHGQSDGEHAWSPDGTKIAFRSFRLGNQDVYVMNSDGSNPIRLTSSIAFDGAPVWSPDGSKIAFVTTRDGREEIYVMNPDGSGKVNLTNHAGDDDQPAWSPDGTRIAFRSDRDGNFEIYVMHADGSDPTRLTNDPAADGSPAWRPVP